MKTRPPEAIVSFRPSPRHLSDEEMPELSRTSELRVLSASSVMEVMSFVQTTALSKAPHSESAFEE